MDSEFDTASTGGSDSPPRLQAPALFNASRNLQAIVGIVPGTRMIGKHALSVVLWEMPKPPPAARHWVGASDARLPIEDFEATKAMPAIDNKTDRAEAAEDVSSSVDADHESIVEEAGESHYAAMLQRQRTSPALKSVDKSGPESESGTFKPISDITLPKRKRQISDASKHRQHSLSQKRACAESKTVIDLTRSPVFRGPNRKRTVPQLSKATQNSNYQPTTPPRYQKCSTWRESEKKLPIYWTPNLTRSIRHWLKHPASKKTQTRLASLSLYSVATGQTPPNPSCFASRDGRVDKTQCPYIFEASNYEKLKIMRLILPDSAQSPLAPPMQLDWLVLVIVSQGISGDGFDSDSETEGIESDNDLPYLLLAFPTTNVTHFHTKAASERGMLLTTIRLGMEQRIPLVHGHGIAKRFVDDFVNACAEGNGAVEMISKGFIPL